MPNRRKISLGDRAGATVTVLGLAAALLALAAAFLPVYEISVNGLPCEPAEASLSGACSGQGSLALIPLALLVVAMAAGAGPGGSRPAAWALLVTGLVILVLTLIIDLPKLDETGPIGINFESATVGPGVGFWLELAAGLLAAASGALRVARPWRG